MGRSSSEVPWPHDYGSDWRSKVISKDGQNGLGVAIVTDVWVPISGDPMPIESRIDDHLG